MQGLDDRHAFGTGGIVGRRRNQRKGIRAVHDRRPLPADQLPQLMKGVAAPYRPPGGLKETHSLDRVVVACESHDRMTVRLQKRRLGGEAQIFAPGLLVKVMAKKDFQGTKIFYLWLLSVWVPGKEVNDFAKEAF